MLDQIHPDTDVFCPGCGYNLRGIDSERCPECGNVVDRSIISQSVILWTHRKHLGKVNAFLRTSWLVLRRPRQLARDSDRPVSYRDAQRFRWIVVVVAAMPWCAGAITTRAIVGDVPGPTYGYNPWQPNPSPMPASLDLAICLWVGVEMWPVPTIAILMFVAGLTGVASYLFHPRRLDVEQQNRAVALSYYACAPLSAMIVPCLLLGGAALMAGMGLSTKRAGFQVFALLICFGSVLPIALLLSMWFATVRLYRDMTSPKLLRLIGVAIVVPILWMIVAVLALGVFPAICGFVKLMIYSATG